jgi:AraC family transcriptional regulator
MTEILTIAPKMLIGVQEVGPSSFNEAEHAGAAFGEQLWRRLIATMLEAGLPLDMDMYGVSWPADDLEPPQLIHYFCGFESSDEVPGLSPLAVEGGSYLQVRHSGPAGDIDGAFHNAYLRVLPESGQRPREGQHLEIYGEEYDPESSVAEFRILIPIHDPS